MMSKISSVIISSTEHPRTVEDLKTSLLYFPVDSHGYVVDANKAFRLECWTYKEDVARSHGPDILGEGWSKALVRKDGAEHFGMVKYASVAVSLAIINQWVKCLTRFTLGDIMIMPEPVRGKEAV